MAPTKQQGPKEKFLKKVQSFSDTLYLFSIKLPSPDKKEIQHRNAS
jgi:hypothetical protein